MPMTDTNIDHYIAGEILEGDAAREMLEEHENNPMRFGILITLGYLRDGQIEQAMQILEQLLEAGRDRVAGGNGDMSVGHTPGQWEVHRISRENSMKGWYVQAADGTHITGWGSVSTTKDNAMLIAAAPLLLAACGALVSLIDNHYRIQYCYHELQDAYNKAKAAIAAARPGEGPGE